MIVLILILAFALRLVNLGQSLWLDEAVQAVVARNSLAFAFEELKGDFHPALFHLLMHYWVRIFCSTEIALRIPSVLFGVGTVWVVYKIGKFGGLGRLGMLGALFLATAPFHIYYSQEARMYSMVTFFTSLSMYYYIKLLTNSRIDKLKDPLFYALTSILALYSDYYAILVILAQIISGIIILRKKFLKLLPCYLAIFLSFIPALPLLISQIKNGIAATYDLPGWGRLVNLSLVKALPLTFIKFSIGRITIFNKKLYFIASGILFLGYFAVILKGFLRSRKLLITNYQLLITFWFVLPILIAWLISLFIPNYQPFRLLLVLPAFYLLLAYGASVINKKLISIGVVILVLAVNMGSLATYYRNPYFWREDWRGVARLINKSNTPIIISAEAFNWPLVYYGVGKKVIPVAKGANIVSLSDFDKLKAIVLKEKELYYTRYLADLYDPHNFAAEWLTNLGFVKIKEVNYNQIPLWVYQNENRH